MTKSKVSEKVLEGFCKPICTGKLGWNRERRKDCRHKYPCRDCKRLMDRGIEKRTDTERLDALQRLIGKYSGKVLCRWSTTGRGLRIAETSNSDAVADLREAIDRFLDNNEAAKKLVSEGGVSCPKKESA